MNAPLSSRDRVAMLAAQGLTIPQIARETGLKDSSIRHHGYKLGITFATTYRPAPAAPKTPREPRLAATPWDAAPGTPRPETTPRTRSHMVSSLHLSQVDMTMAAVRGVLAEVRAERRNGEVV